MKLFATYLNKHFKNKEILLTFADLKQLKGSFKKSNKEYCEIIPYKKNSSVIVPLHKILFVEAFEQ